MPPTQSGRIVKSRKGKTGTPHQKNHRWESFSSKISKLHSLDPLRRVRRHDLDAEDLESTTSYLRNGLDKWADLNISKNFMFFKKEVQSFCDSLPQILHFQDQIMDLLAKYISAQEQESLESLLDLLTAFARDLGPRFEKHYPRALSLIIEIASRPQDAAVVEWTFACLAFLFKYLSKLLVPDLRPTYDALAPLLGKARNPPHISRFAAEALSYLVRKAAAPASRETALPSFIEHARSDLGASRDSRHYGQYYHGLMTVFAEAVKGQGRGVHTTGPELVKYLLASVPNEDCVSIEPVTWADLVCGVLVSIVHHTTMETFEPIPKAIVEAEEADNLRLEYPLRNCLYVRCLGTIAGVRKGTRISDWPSLMKCLLDCLEAISKDPLAIKNANSTVIWQQLMVNIAIVWHQVPMDAAIPHLTKFIATVTREPLMEWFIPFCSYLSELDATRFRSLLLRDFQKFVVMHWSEGGNSDALCVFLPRMIESRALPSIGDSEDFKLPQSWQDQIVTKFEQLEASPFPEQGASNAYHKDPKTWRDKCIPKYSALLHLLESTTVRPATIKPIADLLLRKLKLALRPSQVPATEEARFIVSQGFLAYLRMGKTIGQVDLSLGPLLKAATPRYCRLTGFLEAMLVYEDHLRSKNSPVSESDSSANDDKEPDPFLQCLVENLAVPSHHHRLVSLQLLSKLSSAQDELDTLALMLQIEETPLELQNVRAFAMHSRKLAANYLQLSDSSWLRRAVPSYLFGLLTVRLTPIWDSTVDALQQIGQAKGGEEAICDLAFEWLSVPSKRWEGPSHDSSRPQVTGATDFECRNLTSLLHQAEEPQHVFNNASDIMLQSFEESQSLVTVTPANARSQALKVFSAAPSLAEKRSRKLVPFFLSWTHNDDEHDAQGEEEIEATGASWSLFDKKALLGVIAQFSNPKVLYQSQQVYEALLGLLANGDVEIQKSALKAILTWKQEGVKPYQENLEYLLDEARFKNELTVLFQGDQQIRPEHRAEMMPVLLRLLYGRTISKKGVASGRDGLQATRLAVLRQLSVEDMGMFLDIALGSLRDARVVENASIREDVLRNQEMTPRKQVGFLNMMEAMINELGTSVISYADRILNAVLFCLVSASRKLQQGAESEEEEAPTQLSLIRTIRSTSLRCVVALLRNAPDFEWTPYRDVMIQEIVSPRLEKFAIENTQGISGTLQFLSTLSQIPKLALFLSVDDRIVPKLMESVALDKSKDEVRIYALGIVRSLVKLSQQPATASEFNELIKEELLDPNINLILDKIASVLRSEDDLGKDLLLALVESVVELSPLVQQSGHVAELIDVSVFLLNQPAKRVNPKVKGVILLMLEKFLALEGVHLDSDLEDRMYTTISTLFGFFKDNASRYTLSNVLAVLLRNVGGSQILAELCADLNAFRRGRIDDPDYEKRLAAFNSIRQPRDEPFSPRDWQPLIFNMVFYIKHDEEYGILSANSADGLCSFIEVAANAKASEWEKLEAMLKDIVLPAIHSNAREQSETVRRETLRVLGSLVSQLPSWSPVVDLVPLSPAPDDKDPDPSFFSNILSPATARQIRALQLLTKVNIHTPLSSRHLAHFFIPLLEHFIFNREEGSDDHGVGAQAASTISDVARSLEWPQYRAIMRRYIGYIGSKPEAQKQLIRLLGKFVDALSTSFDERSEDSMDIDDQADTKAPQKHRLTTTLPAHEKFNEDVLSNILPPLFEYLHEKDEATVSSRVPVGIIIAKVLKLLPSESLNQKLPGVLTDICHILRSKAWESREMARDTLAKITSLLGPSYLGFVLKELRGALTTGYQLHVLSYTMHTILVTAVPQFQPGDLDYCLGDIVAIIMDDIFGATGQEKDAEEYVSKMKEVKSSKSQDSMELVARTASINHLVKLVRPLQALLMERLDLRMVRKIDDLLSRITTGLLGNSAAESRDTLVFCYEVIQEVHDSKVLEAEPKIDPRVRRYLLQKGAKKSGENRSTTSRYTYKLVRFAVDILRTVLKKHDSLRTSSNISGFIPIIGDAVVGDEEEVKIAAFKLLTVLAKVPFKTDAATKLYKVSAKEATKCISTSTTTSSDLAQTALKLMSVILRDRRDVEVKDTAVDMLLGKVKDDLTEPLYRHVTFNFLRSVLDRKKETATVYDTLDYVGTVMITNDDKNTRDLARGAFFQFLRDYPQKKNRWAKQLSFVVANLKYEREGGRLSVMEVIHLLLMKSADDFVQEVAANCFIPLVFVLANDDSEKCQLAAGELIKEIFRKADKERTTKFLTLARNWLDQDDNSSVLRLAIQAFALYFEAREPSSKDRKDLKGLLEAIIKVLSEYSSSSDVELLSTVLQTVPILIEKHPATALADEKLWDLVPTPLSHPDPAIKTLSVQLVSKYLADFHGKNRNVAHAQTIVGSHGLQLDQSMIQRLTIQAVGILNMGVVSRWKRKQGTKGRKIASSIDSEAQIAVQDQPELDESLATEASRIVLMMSKFLEVGASDSEVTETDEVDEDDQDQDEEWGGLDSTDEEEQGLQVTLQTLFVWLSDILVEETRPKASLLIPKMAALDILSILAATLPTESLQPSLNLVLAPLHHLTDPSIPMPFSLDETFKTRLEGLKTKATETMDTLQRRLGTATYSQALLRVRDCARARREGRSRKRKIEAVAQPERFGDWKRGRLEKKVKRRKEKGLANRDRRHQW
ncbi:HEAT repeat protein [Xylariomycetidae sp. FL0641]|nr:HEAT repeat protein [Xylariomycetidae sp. FL0641]